MSSLRLALALYAVIGAATLAARNSSLAWLVPVLATTPDDLVWPARVSTFLVMLSLAVRFPLGLFNNLFLGHQRFDLQNLATSSQPSSMRSSSHPASARRRPGPARCADVPVDVLRLGLPLVWLRRSYHSSAQPRLCTRFPHARADVGVSWSNFLVHLANKVVFSTDVVVVGIVLGAEPAALYAIPPGSSSSPVSASVVTPLLYPALSEYEGSGELERQRRLLLSGLRGATAPRSCWRCRCCSSPLT